MTYVRAVAWTAFNAVAATPLLDEGDQTVGFELAHMVGDCLPGELEPAGQPCGRVGLGQFDQEPESDRIEDGGGLAWVLNDFQGSWGHVAGPRGDRLDQIN